LNELSTFSARTNTGQIGTAKWMAPEVVADEKYSKKADVWFVFVLKQTDALQNFRSCQH